MSIEHSTEHKGIVLRMIEAFNKGYVDGFVQFFAERVVNHSLSVERQDIEHIVWDIQGTYPDVQLERLQLLAEGDWVGLRARFCRTHRGVGRLPVNGGLLVGVSPTEKQFAAAQSLRRSRWR